MKENNTLVQLFVTCFLCYLTTCVVMSKNSETHIPVILITKEEHKAQIFLDPISS